LKTLAELEALELDAENNGNALVATYYQGGIDRMREWHVEEMHELLKLINSYWFCLPSRPKYGDGDFDKVMRRVKELLAKLEGK